MRAREQPLTPNSQPHFLLTYDDKRREADHQALVAGLFAATLWDVRALAVEAAAGILFVWEKAV